MANSIIATVSRFVTPEVVGKLAAASGLDRSLTQSVIGAAVPSILSALTGLVAQPSGARQLANAAAEQPADILGGITGSLTGSALTGVEGADQLSSLLGGGAFGALISTVSKFLGIGEGPTRTLIGLLTPLILGVVGREQRAAGLDAGGLARMLMGQKAEIVAAMPAGLNKLLETGNRLHESIASPASPERRASGGPGGTYAAAAMQPPPGDTSWRRASWPYWVLPLLVLVGVLWYLLAREPEPVGPAAPSKSTSEPTRGVQTAAAYLSSAPDNWVSIGTAPNEYVNRDIYNRAGEHLGTIQDVLVGPDGKMAAAIINVGRYLGIGDKEVAVAFSTIQQQRGDSGLRIVIDATKDNLQAAPTFARHASSKR
jgi:hypothetical protein